MRKIASQEELEELHAANVGLIYNDFSGRGAGGAQYNVLHAAGCHWVARSNTNVRKLFFDSLAEAIEWLNANRGSENKSWKRCGSCRSTTRAAANQAVADRRGALVDTTPRSSSSAPPAEWDVVGASRAHPCVEAWSTVRLPFGASGEIKEFQRALRAAIAELRANEGELLAAVYASESRERVDAENVLFYNIESSAAFAHSTRGGLRFERSYAPPRPPARITAAAHYHRYWIADEADGFASWRVGDSSVARFEAEPTLLGSLDVAGLWYALNRGNVDLRGRAEIAGDFALRVKVVLPRTHRSPNAAVFVKPIFDAAIAALQWHDHRKSLPEVSARLAARLALSAPEVASLLEARANAVLGSTRLLWPWGNTVQWNPCDDRCVAGELLVSSGTAWALIGEVYEFAPR